MGAEIVLPGDNFLPGWRKDAKPEIFIKTDLFNHIDGGADLFLEFGFGLVTIQRYKKGSAELTLEMYEMEGPDSALGVYLMKCGRETPLAGIPARNSSESTQATIIKGRYFVLINNFSGGENLLPTMVALAGAALKNIDDELVSKQLFDLLPQKDRIKGSERLVRGPVVLQPFFTFGEGDILQLKGKIFGVVANYQENPDSVFTRFIIPYPDGGRAAAVYQNLLSNLDPYLKILEARDSSFAFIDFREKYGLVEIRGPTLDIRVNLGLRPKI